VGRIERLSITGVVDDSCKERLDKGVSKNDEISIYYDPMIAKQIVHGANREKAIYELRESLEWSSIDGVKTNVDFLVRLLANYDFNFGSLTTQLIPTHISELVNDPNRVPPMAYANAAVGYLNQKKFEQTRTSRTSGKSLTPFDDFAGFRLNSTNEATILFENNGEVHPVKVIWDKNLWRCCIDGASFIILDELADEEDDSWETLSFAYAWSPTVSNTHVTLKRMGRRVNVPLYLAGSSNIEQTSNALSAPMPGKIIAVNAKAGETVKAGDPLIIMEAMTRLSLWKR